jgi:predicted DNA-binding protein with PD1-like motif
MKSKCVAQEPDQRIFVLILDAGEEAFASISRFAEREGLHGASLTALGAFEKAKVGWFDPKERTYKSIPIGEQCEVLRGCLGTPSQGLKNGITNRI